ncbi:MAG: tetratricopeptide repeat protein [Candidatus Sulfotelmatobacter sp.]
MRAVLLFLIALVPSLIAAQEANPDLLLQRAIDAQQHGNFSEAIRDYRQVLKLRPDNVEAKVNLGAALAHVGRFDEAIALYRSALPLLKNKTMVQLNLALAYYKKGDYEHAREEFADLHNANPSDLRSIILLADSELHLGKADAALALLEPLEGQYSANLDFEYVLGSAFIHAGKRREGIVRVEKVAEARSSPDAYMLAGATLLDLNEYPQARRDLEEALRLNPSLPGVNTLAGIARDKTGDAKAAEAAFRAALQADPNDFQANLYLGGILCKRREITESKVYLDRALQLNPADSMARYESAMLKSASGDYSSAARELEQLTKDDPDFLEPHIELAALYYRLHRPQDGARERQIVEQLTAKQQAQGPGK